MPAVDYDYNYYNSARKVNKTANTRRTTKVDSSVLASSNRKQSYNKTSDSTKNQVRQAMYESPKTQSSKRQSKSAGISRTSQRSTKRNVDLDIPVIDHGKKVTVANRKTVEKQVANRQIMNKKVKSKNNAKPVEMKLKKPEASSMQKKKARAKAVSRVKNVLYLCLGFAIAFLICYRYSLINEKFNILEKTKKELATAQTVNEQIQADIDSQTDLSYIENYAKYQLGMQKPSNSQIVYVNVEKEDRILTPITIEENSEKTWLDQLYEEIVKLFE